MPNKNEQEDIKSLQSSLAIFEQCARDTRRKLKKLLWDKESRRCHVKIYWSDDQQMYLTQFIRESVVLYTLKSKKYARGHATVGIESVDGKGARVSWKLIEAGGVWTASAIVSDWFWEKYIDLTDVPSSKVISIEAFRSLRKRQLYVERR